MNIFSLIMNQKKITRDQDLSQFTIIKILKKLSVKEINEFDKLVNSPFFNNHSTVTKLFKELKKHHPEYSGSILTREFLYNIVNKGEKYNDVVFQKYMSRLKMLSDEYLNILEMREDPLKKELNILKKLSRIGAVEIFSGRFKNIEKSLEEVKEIDPKSFLFKHHLTDININSTDISKNIITNSSQITDSYDSLLAYFIFVSAFTLNQLELNQYSMKDSGDFHSSGTFFNKSKILRLISEIITNCNDSDKKRFLFFQLIKFDMKLKFHKPDMSAYRNLKNLVFKNAEVISKDLLEFYLRRMIAFCIIQSAKGMRNMSKEIFENYKFFIEKELFDAGGVSDLQLLDYRAIVSSSTNNNETEWLEDFINTKSHLIKNELRNNIYHYGYACILFHKKDYEGSLDHILKLVIDSPPLILDIYFLKSKIFYEIEMPDSARSIADSFRHYISNNSSFSDFFKLYLKTFLKHYKTLLKFKSKSVKSESDRSVKSNVKSFLNELEKSKNLRDKKWLIEKTRELL